MGEDEEAPVDSKKDRESAAAAASLDKLTDHVCTPPPPPQPTILSPTRPCNRCSSSAEVHRYFRTFNIQIALQIINGLAAKAQSLGCHQLPRHIEGAEVAC